MTNSKIPEEFPSAKLWRQFAAMFYDAFLIIAILFVATAIVLPFNQGQAYVGVHWFELYKIMIIFVFYCWFWNRNGQTLGMQVWKIKIVSDFGGNPSWAVCSLRLIFALISFICLGMGYWWRLFKPYTWHDRLSQTRIIDISSASKN